MKNIIKSTLLLVAGAALLFSCSPMDTDTHKLGPAPTEAQLSFTATPSSANPNIIELKNTSSVKGVALWDLGNGANAKGDEVTATFPFKGDYTISMSLYTSGGGASISKVVTVAADDYGLLDTPGFNALTGGASAENGKTWVFAKYTVGHFGVDDVNNAPNDNIGGWWWACPSQGKEGSCLYSNEFTFIQKGTKFVWKNNGNIYTNQNGMDHIGISGTATPVDDFDVPYVPADDLTFTLDEENGILTLSGGAFLGHYAGTSEYHIMKLDEHELMLWCKSVPEPGNAWYYIFVPKDELKEPEVEPVDPKPESEPAWFRPNAATNLLRTVIDYDQWFSGADWSGGLEPGISIKNDIVITVPDGVGGGEWMGQFKIKTGVPADARERFDFSCNIHASQAGTATVKMTSAADGDDSFFYNGNVGIGAGEDLLFQEADHMLFEATESILLVFDFGRFPAGTVITINNLCLQKHIALSEKPEVVNLWPAAEVTVSEIYFTAPGWGGGLDPQFTPGEGNRSFQITIPEGIGGEEWMGQVKLSTDITLQASLDYEFTCKVEATAAAPFTIKLTNDPEADGKVSFYDNALNTKDGAVTIRKQGFHPAEDAEKAFLIFDFGRTPAGTVVKVSDIVLQAFVE